MSIYTRSGDAGETSLGDGTRASKCDVRVEAYGALDEAVTAVGFARVVVAEGLLSQTLTFIQHRLFNCSAALQNPREPVGSPLSQPQPTWVCTADVEALESLTDRLMGDEGFSGFILPAGSEAAARCHLARVALRRAERRLSYLDETDVDPTVRAFVNRCSDTLFAAACSANASREIEEEPWDRYYPPPDGS